MDDDTEHIQEQDEAHDDTSTEELEGPYDSDDRELVRQPGSAPDVFLEVPELKVDEITLDVEDLRAHVSLHAEVLDLLKLDVGADVQLGKVHLDIKGVSAEALLKVRLDRVAAIIGRVLTTIDRNPQILEHVTSAVGGVARDLGRGAGEAVGELGRGAGETVGELGRGAGEAVGEVGRGAGEAVGEVGRGAGEAVGEVGRGAGGAVGEVGRHGAEAVGHVGEGAGAVAKEGVSGAAKDVGETVEGVAEGTRQTVDTARRTGDKAQGSAGADDRDRDERDTDEREEAADERGAPRRPTVRRGPDRRREGRPP